MHVVTLARGSYTSSIAGEREEKRGEIHKTFLEVGNVLLHTDSLRSSLFRSGLLVGHHNIVLTALETLALASAAALAGFLIGKCVTHSETVCSSVRRPRSR